jgi:hypothetical protein
MRMLQNVDRIAGGVSAVKAKHAQASAIIDGGILEAARDDLHRVHLNAISRQWPTVSLWGFRRPPPHQWRSLTSMKDLPDRSSGQAKIMMA